ncbi:MAG: GTPase domain-containing protein [Cyanobacteriota bacterium]
MSVIVIGDRSVGKTSMVVALADPGTDHITVVNPDSESFVARYLDKDKGTTAPTFQKKEETLLINVDLPAGERQIQVRWIDTPGEAFSNKDWRNDKPSAWQDIQKEVSQSQGVLLLVPPHRTLVQPHLLEEATEPVDPDELQTSNAWVNRLKTWLEFLSKNCTRGQHILICIHKADLFCDIQAESKRWRYDHSRSRPWFDYNNHIRNTYFTAANEIIRQYNSRTTGSSLRFFITTTKNQSLLELPWIYLGAYIANA